MPSALADSVGSNAMCVIFYLWIYLLGFSTLTAVLWGQVSILNDLKYMKKLTKPTLLIGLLVIQLLMSLPLCTNTGLLIVDILHHYLFYYIVPIIVLFECMVVGWL